MKQPFFPENKNKIIDTANGRGAIVSGASGKIFQGGKIQ